MTRSLEAALSQSEARYQALVNLAPDAIVVHQDERVVYANAAALRLYGAADFEDLSRRNIIDLVHPDDRETIRARAQLVEGGGISPLRETRILRLDGRVAPVEATAANIDYQGKPAVLAILRDITGRKRLEADLGAAARFPRENPNPVMRLSQGHILSFANAGSQSLLKLWGCTIGEEVPAEIAAPAVAALAVGVPREAEATYAGRAYLFDLIPIPAEDYVNLYARDITESKQAEEALRGSEGRFRVLAEAMPQIVWSADVRSGVDYCNPQASLYTGVRAEDVGGGRWMSVIHPDDVAATASAWHQAKASGQAGQIEHRWRRSDGEFRWHLTRGAPARNEKGEVIRWIFSATDIHEQKTAEQELERRVTERTAELARSKAQLETVTANAPVILFATDARGVFTVHTGKGVIESGREPGDLLGKDYRDLLPERAEAVDYIQRALAGETFTATLAGVGGGFFETRYSPLLDVDGKITGMIAVAVDITERMRAEEALRESQALTSSIIDGTSDLIWSVDPEHFGLTTFNAGLRDHFLRRGVRLQTGMRPEDVFADPTLAARWSRIYERALAEGSFVTDYDSSTAGYMVVTVNLLRRDGKAFGISAFGKDITQRKRAEQALRRANTELERANRTLKVVSECNQTLIHAEEETAFLHEVCRIIVEVGGYRMVWVGFADHDEAKTVRPIAHAGFDAGYLAQAGISWGDNERGRGPTGIAIRTGRPVVNRNSEQDPIVSPWREEQLRRGYACSIGLPFRAGSQLQGAFTLYAAELDAFDDQEISLLSELAADIGFGIDTIRTRIDRQRNAEAVRDLYNNAPCGYHSLDPNGIILRMNDTELQWLGYTHEEVIGKLNFADVLTENSRRVFAENFPRFKESGVVRDLEFEFMRKDGTTFPILLSATAVWDEEGNYHMSRSTVYDMTEKKRAQELVATERQRLFDVLETLPAYVVLLTPDYHVPFANRFFRERFGESHGKRCYEYLFGRTEPCEICDTYTVLKTMRPHRWEWTGPDGRIYDIYDHPFTDSDGSPLILEMGIDITERKHAEEALRQLSAQLLRAQDDERRRVARELHDSIGQELAALDLNLGWIRQSVGALDPRTEGVIDESAEIVKQCSQEIRDFSYLLYPPLLDEYGLASALHWYTEGFARRTRIQVTLDIASNLPRRSRDVETALFRVVQECLTNVHRHAASPTVSIRIVQEANRLSLEVADQGHGVHVATPGSPASRPGTGLAGMRERMRELGGALEIESGTHGTIVRASLPTEEEKAA